MGNDTIDVSKKSQQQTGDRGSNRGTHAAMSQQGDSGRGTQSVPQKLVQLVGYRDPKSCRESWTRPPAPAQR